MFAMLFLFIMKLLEQCSSLSSIELQCADAIDWFHVFVQVFKTQILVNRIFLILFNVRNMEFRLKTRGVFLVVVE